MGCLKEDQINIIIHGHETNLFESMLDSVNDPTLIEAAKDTGAEGINLLGMCCSGAEMLSRHGIPHAGKFMSTETIFVTGAVTETAQLHHNLKGVMFMKDENIERMIQS